MEKIEVGSVVLLKSGGPDMTVDKYVSGNTYRCIWFNDSDQYEGNFDLKSLKLKQLIKE